MPIKIDFKEKQTSWLKEHGYSIADEEDIYNAQLDDVAENIRWYLDNLRFMREYRVSWNCYRSKTPTLPYNHVKTRDKCQE